MNSQKTNNSRKKFYEKETAESLKNFYYCEQQSSIFLSLEAFSKTQKTIKGVSKRILLLVHIEGILEHDND